MYYVIQENLFNEHHYNTLIEFLRRNKLEFETVRYTPFVKEVNVENPNNYTNVWFFGSVNAGMVLAHKDWYPGIMYNEGHDFVFYKEKYGNKLLNADCRIKPFSHIISTDFPYFIRPTRDNKIFPSQVYSFEEWNNYVDTTIDSNTYGEIYDKTQILYCKPKTIQQEIRCWIVDGEPVTMSQYKIGRRVNMLNMDNNEEAYIFAKQMAKLYCPSRVFVLDICLHEDEYKVVEINCANMSGFYDIDMSKLIQSLEKAFNATPKSI